MSAFIRVSIAATLAAVAFAGCQPEPSTPDESDIIDAGTYVPPKPDCVKVAEGSQYALCDTAFLTDTFQRTDRFELTGDLRPVEQNERHRGQRFVVVGGLAE